ncbi:ACT domain-containing protein [Natroniella sulfidigena]|uniref:ACT domain-containing protein n=1 Tax=Natroniella sulfidigena TaxID=723921 RepID=UPI00200A24E3|nr:ACT domain-containing protein [Natroniella sulfidigena]MCK8816130.1 ACT domain-containing protein [Natroniella sulfidigena]
MHQQADNSEERAVVTVLGADKVGIVAKVTTALANHNANIVDISQTLLEDIFSMIMLIEISNLKTDFETLNKELTELEEEINVEIKLQHENIFKYMHRV